MFLLIVFGVIILRLLYVIYKIFTQKELRRRGYAKVKTAVIIGSGGHTTEMLRLIENLNPVLYGPRTYLMAQGDTTSEIKVHKLEAQFNSKCEKESKDYTVARIPRSREVGQSYFSSVCSTIYSVIYCIPIMLKERPELILTNGPGTCIPICLIAFLMKVFFMSDVTIVFVESICRVKTLSLSGKILLPFADIVFVQWPDLQVIYKRTKYIGRLV